MHQHGDRFERCVLGRSVAEKVSASSHRLSTRAIREQAEVANAHEATRHDVEQKASEEFVGVERQDLDTAMVGVVLPAESDAAVAVIDEAIVGQRDAVRVATEILEDLLGAGKGPLGIDDPIDGPELAEETAERVRTGEWRGATRKRQRVAIECALERGEILRAKDGRERPDRKQERGSPGDPLRTVPGQRPAGDETVQMEMLPPAPTIP